MNPRAPAPPTPRRPSRLALARSRARHPPTALASPWFLRRRPGPALAAHRRVLTSAPPGVSVLPWHGLRLWQLARWVTVGAPRAVDRLAGSALVREDPSFDPALVRRLARRHGLPPAQAVRYGLVHHERWRDWPAYVFEGEVGWNEAASPDPVVARAHLVLLADKHATAQRLAAAGIPVAEEEVVGPVHDARVVAALAERWLEQWGEVFVKPREGSRGHGALVVAPAADGWTVVPHQRGQAVDDPGGALATALAAGAHVVQPRLRSGPDLAVVAEPYDVVTARVVTRDLGDGPEVFSTALEVPLPLGDDGRAVYAHLVVAPDGTVGRLAVAAATPSPAAAAIEAALRGTVPAGADRLASLALAAHACVPGLFAVAWDVALTDGGPVVLEGNTGFGTVVPQLIAGGLYAGLRPRP